MEFSGQNVKVNEVSFIIVTWFDRAGAEMLILYACEGFFPAAYSCMPPSPGRIEITTQLLTKNSGVAR